MAGQHLLQMDRTELLRRLAAARLPLVLGAVILLMSRGVLLASRWMLCLALLHRRFSRAFVLTAQLAAIFANHVTPTARLLGGVLRARYFGRRYDTPFVDAYATVFLDQTTHQVVQALLTWVMLAALAWHASAEALATGLGVGLLILIAGLWAWWGRRSVLTDSSLAQWIRAVIERRGFLATATGAILETLRLGLADRRLQLRLAGLAVAVLAVGAMAQWLVFLSLGSTVSPWVVTAVVTVGIAAGVLSGTPGGIATTEAAMIGGFVALGVEEIAATAATLLYRGLHYLVVSTLGLPALLYCEGSLGRPLKPADRPAAEDPSAGPSPATGSRPDPSA